MKTLSKISKPIAVAATLAIALVGTIVLTINARPTVPAAQHSFPLTCRGGGALSITNEGRNVRINFQKGSGPLTAGLSPGQCTWSDRALRSGEEPILRDTGTQAAQYVDELVQQDKYVILQIQNAGAYLRVVRVGP